MRGRRPILKTIDGGKPQKSAIPMSPAQVPKSQRKEWDRVVTDLQARGLYEPSATAVIASYVVATWQIQQCVKAIEKDGAFVRTKAGEPKPHPAHDVMNKANEIVARLGAELGLTPSARQRRGLQGPSQDNDDDLSALGV